MKQSLTWLRPNFIIEYNEVLYIQRFWQSPYHRDIIEWFDLNFPVAEDHQHITDKLSSLSHYTRFFTKNDHQSLVNFPLSWKDLEERLDKDGFLRTLESYNSGRVEMPIFVELNGHSNKRFWCISGRRRTSYGFWKLDIPVQGWVISSDPGDTL
jgi:hypothetical protein